MPGCGDQEVPEGLRDTLKEFGIDGKAVPMPSGPFKDEPAPDTNKPFVRDMQVDELEKLIEKCVRRVLQGEDIKREFAKLQAEIKK